MKTGWLPSALAAVLVPTMLVGPVRAQAHDHAVTHGAAAGHAAEHALLSAAAHEQIHALEQAVGDLADVDAASAAGFRPALGMIPTMGTHWVSVARMRSGAAGTDLTRPEHLMFSPMEGEQRLVGVAFAYQATSGQQTPDLFDGDADAWHTHPEISPPGQELTMLHVWLVPSPDGPFAGHNPWLAYWAVGLEPPDAARLADAADSYRIRALGLALSETVDDGRDGRLLARVLAQSAAEVEPRRARIRELIPVLGAAQAAGDLEAWNEAADAAAAEGEAIRAAQLESIGAPLVRARLAGFYEQMLTGGHAAH
jgi:hypothetical protein